MMTLKDWRDRRKMSQITLGQALGVHQSTVSKWERGADKPSLIQAAAIERLTAGKVKAVSWVEAA